MKEKLLSILAILLFVCSGAFMTSCSSDDEGQGEGNGNTFYVIVFTSVGSYSCSEDPSVTINTNGTYTTKGLTKNGKPWLTSGTWRKTTDGEMQNLTKKWADPIKGDVMIFDDSYYVIKEKEDEHSYNILIYAKDEFITPCLMLTCLTSRP